MSVVEEGHTESDEEGIRRKMSVSADAVREEKRTASE